MLWQNSDALLISITTSGKKKCTLHHLTISSKNSLFKFVQRKIIKEEEGADGGQKNNVLVNNVLQNDLTEFINHLLLPKGGI